MSERPGGIRLALVNDLGAPVATTVPGELEQMLHDALRHHLPTIALGTSFTTGRWGETATQDLEVRLRLALEDQVPRLATRKQVIAAFARAFKEVDIQFQGEVMDAFGKAFREVDVEFRRRSLARGKAQT